MKITSGSLTNERASVKRRFIPPDNSPILASRLADRLANSSSDGMRALMVASDKPK